MQYGQALDWLIRDFVISDSALGPVHILKSDASDGFNRIDLRTMDAPKLGLIFPSEEVDEELVAIPLTLPMEWKKSPPLFCTVLETVVDQANIALLCNTLTLPHSLDGMAESIVREELPTFQPVLSELTIDPYLSQANQ